MTVARQICIFEYGVSLSGKRELKRTQTKTGVSEGQCFSYRRFFASPDASSLIWTQVERFGRFFQVQFSMCLLRVETPKTKSKYRVSTVVFAGDFFRFPPVPNAEDDRWFCFRSPLWPVIILASRCAWYCPRSIARKTLHSRPSFVDCEFASGYDVDEAFMHGHSWPVATRS